MITFNNPGDSQRRQNVEPLSVEEIQKIAKLISQMLDQAGANEWTDVTNKIQRLFDHYSNLLHLSSNVGGWEGLSKLQEIADSIAVNNDFPFNEEFWVQAKWLIENKLSGQTINKDSIKKEYFSATGENIHGSSVMWATKKLQEMKYLTMHRDEKHEIYYKRTQE